MRGFDWQKFVQKVTSIDATIEQVKEEIRGLAVADENIDFKGDNKVAEN